MPSILVIVICAIMRAFCVSTYAIQNAQISDAKFSLQIVSTLHVYLLRAQEIRYVMAMECIIATSNGVRVCD